jgi:hypothetical protein
MKSSGVFLHNSEVPAIFGVYGIIFLKKSVEYIHGSVDRVHQRRLMGLRTSLNAGRWLPDQRLGLNQSNQHLCSGV